MPPQPHRPEPLAWQVFRGSDAIRRGLLTRHQLRGAAWLRLGHDVYADARLDRDHALICRAAVLRMPAGSVIAGPSAAYLHGVEHAAGFGDEVHVLVPRAARVGSQGATTVTSPGGVRPRSAGGVRLGSPGGIRVHSVADAGGPAGPRRPPASDHHPEATPLDLPGTTRSDLPRTARSDLPQTTRSDPPQTTRLGLPGTTQPDRSAAIPLGLPAATTLDPPPMPISPPRSSPALAAWETAAWLEPVRAVGIVDALLGGGLTSPAALAEIAQRFADRRGGRRASRVFALADPAAQSPPESHLRVRLVLAGLPRPVAQHPVRLPSGLVLHPDLAWPEFRVAVEYDGHWHTDPDQMHRDRRRLNQLVAAGWVVLHVTSRRLRGDFPAVLREVRDVLAQRGWCR
ncbi:hypothetical protein ACIG87_16335 [Micromonospora sp. NPDC051925]|uniref:hypothetical protein n=1 Tax=Micromonospora sp. NPDC051925 TaxID=3364288 RepID=UPI0037C7E251